MRPARRGTSKAQLGDFKGTTLGRLRCPSTSASRTNNHVRKETSALGTFQPRIGTFPNVPQRPLSLLTNLRFTRTQSATGRLDVSTASSNSLAAFRNVPKRPRTPHMCSSVTPSSLRSRSTMLRHYRRPSQLPATVVTTANVGSATRNQTAAGRNWSPIAAATIITNDALPIGSGTIRNVPDAFLASPSIRPINQITLPLGVLGVRRSNPPSPTFP